MRLMLNKSNIVNGSTMLIVPIHNYGAYSPSSFSAHMDCTLSYNDDAAQM